MGVCFNNKKNPYKSNIIGLNNEEIQALMEKKQKNIDHLINRKNELISKNRIIKSEINHLKEKRDSKIEIKFKLQNWTGSFN